MYRTRGEEGRGGFFKKREKKREGGDGGRQQGEKGEEKKHHQHLEAHHKARKTTLERNPEHESRNAFLFLLPPSTNDNLQATIRGPTPAETLSLTPVHRSTSRVSRGGELVSNRAEPGLLKAVRFFALTARPSEI